MALPQRNEKLLTVPIFVGVEPLKRPRVGNSGHVYQPKDNQIKVLAELQTQSLNQQFDQPIIVDTYFYYARPKTVNTPYPCTNSKWPGDIDNLNKGLFDNLVDAQILKDDSFIVGGESFKMWSTDDHAMCIIWSIA